MKLTFKARPFSQEETKLKDRFKNGHMESFLRLYRSMIVKRRQVYNRLGTPCWEWAGATDKDGYAKIKFEGKDWKVYRLVWTFINGPIPEGMEVDHKCQTRNCFNPDHLQLATPEENKKLIKTRRDELQSVAGARVCTEQNILEWSPQDLEQIIRQSGCDVGRLKLIRIVGKHKEIPGNVYEFYCLTRSAIDTALGEDPKLGPLYDVVAYMVDFFSDDIHGVPYAEGPIPKEEGVSEQEASQYILTTNN